MKVGDCWVLAQSQRARELRQRKARRFELLGLLLALTVGLAAVWYTAGYALDHPVNALRTLER